MEKGHHSHAQKGLPALQLHNRSVMLVANRTSHFRAGLPCYIVRAAPMPGPALTEACSTLQDEEAARRPKSATSCPTFISYISRRRACFILGPAGKARATMQAEAEKQDSI